MGQHRVQRQILRKFSFGGRQLNSREAWWLNTGSYQPARRSTNRVGFFEVNCSEDVDGYITEHENTFKEPLRRFSQGEFTRTDVGRELYDFIAIHYVRSQACRRQIEHLVSESKRTSRLTQLQAEMEIKRLTSYQDVEVFDELVDSVSRVLTHYLGCPIVMIGPWAFVTSDKIMCASKVESEQRLTLVWFPISPSAGLCLDSDGNGGQILGPIAVDRRFARISFVKIPEARWLRCQSPSSQEGSTVFVNTLNGIMVEGSTELYATDPASMDSALHAAEQPTGYRYRPTR